MAENFFNKTDLPYSNRIQVSKLLSTFKNKTTSYKYLWFLSILDILEKDNFNANPISFTDIRETMLLIAWHPYKRFHLSFGINDKIPEILDRATKSLKKENTEDIKKIISSIPLNKNELLDFVPFRLISHFFEVKDSNLKNSSGWHKEIIKLSKEITGSQKPFYIFTEDEKSIIVDNDWKLYFLENLELIKKFIYWEWVEYLQRRNPTVPNLQQKLFAPTVRESLKVQTEYWKTVIKFGQVKCIYSDELISLNDLSLDHFLPWSYLAHNQLWNLIPVSRSINSSKSDNLPSLDLYLKKFSDVQFYGLKTFHQTFPDKKIWDNRIEPFLQDLKLNKDNILNEKEFKTSLIRIIKPLYHLAKNQGFSANWKYQ